MIKNILFFFLLSGCIGINCKPVITPSYFQEAKNEDTDKTQQNLILLDDENDSVR